MSVDLVEVPDELLDDDEQESPRLEEVLDRWIRAGIAEVRVAIPGVVLGDVDETSATVTVRPTVRDVFGDGTLLPEAIARVPVAYPAGGGYALTLPLAKGDPCIILCCDREVRTWIRAGSAKVHDVTPVDRRRHSYAGAIVIPGVEPAQLRRSVVVGDRARLGSADVALALTDAGKVTIGTSSVELLAELRDELDELTDTLDALLTFAGAVVTATTTVGTAAQNATALAAIGLAATVLSTTGSPNLTAIRAAVASTRANVNTLTE